MRYHSEGCAWNDVTHTVQHLLFGGNVGVLDRAVVCFILETCQAQGDLDLAPEGCAGHMRLAHRRKAKQLQRCGGIAAGWKDARLFVLASKAEHLEATRVRLVVWRSLSVGRLRQFLPSTTAHGPPSTDCSCEQQRRASSRPISA